MPIWEETAPDPTYVLPTVSRRYYLLYKTDSCVIYICIRLTKIGHKVDLLYSLKFTETMDYVLLFNSPLIV
jgi:hypothetical protein